MRIKILKNDLAQVDVDYYELTDEYRINGFENSLLRSAVRIYGDKDAAFAKAEEMFNEIGSEK